MVTSSTPTLFKYVFIADSGGGKVEGEVVVEEKVNRGEVGGGRVQGGKRRGKLKGNSRNKMKLVMVMVMKAPVFCLKSQITERLMCRVRCWWLST